MQLVGVAALFVASKYEELYPPEVHDFVYITDNTYTKDEILKMEKFMLKVRAYLDQMPSNLWRFQLTVLTHILNDLLIDLNFFL